MGRVTKFCANRFCLWIVWTLDSFGPSINFNVTLLCPIFNFYSISPIFNYTPLEYKTEYLMFRLKVFLKDSKLITFL